MLRAMAAERQRTMQIDGRRFAWRSLGAGPPLLLINGYAASSADWDAEFVAKLAASFELICPNNRGMGDSELGEPGELSVDAMAGDLQSLLDELGFARAAVAGWSMGGYVAQRLALRAPKRVAAMVLLATAPGGPTAVAPEPQAWARLIDHSGTPREQATRLISLLFPPGIAPQIDREFGEAVAAARAQLSERALFAQEHALGAWHAEAPELPGSGSPPVFVLCGSEDVVIPPQNSELLAAFWPGARSERFAGTGHAFIAQQPDRVAELIAGFAGG
jgi:pimeloyl-ACP methyl ester carboxylesterase